MLQNLVSASSINVFRAVLQFAMTLVLTRFIEASEYGILAFVLPIWLFVSLVSEMGIGTAIVRSERLTDGDAGAALRLTGLSGLAGAVAIAAAAYPVGIVMGDGRIGAVLAVFAVVLVLAMLATTPRALVERDLRYVAIARIEAGSTVAGVPVCLALAVAGFGVWSLVVYHVLVQVLRLAFYLRLTWGRFDLTASIRSVLPLLAVGGWILASNVQNFVARNIDNILIGVVLGTAALGVYALSYQIMVLPLMVITWPASSVLMATLSAARRRGDTAPQRYVRALMTLTAALTFPAMAYVAIGIDYPVGAFMGPSWAGVPDILFWLAPVGAAQSVGSYSGAVLISAGRVRFNFVLGITGTAVYLALFLGTVRFGLDVLVPAYCLVSLAIVGVHLWVIRGALSWPVVGLLGTLAIGSAAAAAGVLAHQAVARLAIAGDALAWQAGTSAFALAALSVLALFRQRLLGEIAVLAQRKQVPDGVPAAV